MILKLSKLSTKTKMIHEVKSQNLFRSWNTPPKWIPKKLWEHYSDILFVDYTFNILTTENIKYSFFIILILNPLGKYEAVTSFKIKYETIDCLTAAFNLLLQENNFENTQSIFSDKDISERHVFLSF